MSSAIRIPLPRQAATLCPKERLYNAMVGVIQTDQSSGVVACAITCADIFQANFIASQQLAIVISAPALRAMIKDPPIGEPNLAKVAASSVNCTALALLSAYEFMPFCYGDGIRELRRLIEDAAQDFLPDRVSRAMEILNSPALDAPLREWIERGSINMVSLIEKPRLFGGPVTIGPTPMRRLPVPEPV